MLSSVLRSPRSVQVNVAIMRVFVRLRETLALHKELAHKLAELESQSTLQNRDSFLDGRKTMKQFVKIQSKLRKNASNLRLICYNPPHMNTVTQLKTISGKTKSKCAAGLLFIATMP